MKIKTEELVPPHTVRSYFGHRRQLSKQLSELHKAAMDQVYHDSSVDRLMSHLLGHKSGFYVIDRCPNCKKEFEALRVGPPKDYEAKFREYDEQGPLKFEYDIGAIGLDGNLMAVIEAFNTHQMGAEKRVYLDNKGYPWIEYSVSSMLLSDRNGAIHSRPGGWLELEALKLKIGHSGATRCKECATEFERERLAVENSRRVLGRITDSQEVQRKLLREVLGPTSQELEQLEQELDGLDFGFSKASLGDVEYGLNNVESLVNEIQDRLNEIGPVIAQIQEIEVETEKELKLRKRKSVCSKTGLILASEICEQDLNGFRDLSMTFDVSARSVIEKCLVLQERITNQRREITSIRELLD